ncbi:MAG: GAF domain-containing protein [Scytolyngbya sp. HA4215-MV1]|jgi:GAF domain-containing protein|nr:GAF domain-containing protein [Scytolyngbya sp. HA4215-MV1]
MVQQKDSTAHDKQLVSLGRVLQTLREEENPDVLIDTILNYIHNEFDYHLIWIGLYDRLDHRLFGKGGFTPTGENTFLKQKFALNSGDLLEQVVIQQRPVGVPDLRAELHAGEWRKAAQKFNIQGTVIFPIRHRDRCFGVAMMGSSLWGISPRPDEKARLSMVLGNLAASLDQIETDWQRQQTKRPDEPMFALLNKLRTLSSLGDRLETVVEETHRFISPTRTNIYWFERERRYFWRRVSNRQKATAFGEANQPSSGITVQEVNSFYQALLSDQVVSIGEAHSSLKADTTSRLMQQIRARSLLAAPILFQNELLGFLAVEGNEARIWEKEEKEFLRAVAQLIALTTPLHEMETSIQQAKLDQVLTAEIARAIYGDDDWKNTLKNCADNLCKRLQAERFVVLLHNKDQNHFEVCYQSQPNNRRLLPTGLEPLNQSDWELLERTLETVSIENLDDDLRLLAWRHLLLESGVRSLLLCNTSLDQPLEGVLMICHEAPRSWSRVERDLVKVVSQQIGLMLHQWQLQRQTEQQQKIYQTIQWGLTSIQQSHQVDRLEQSALQHLNQVLQAPLTILVNWAPGRRAGRIVAPINNQDKFALNSEIVIQIQTDSLIQWALQNDGLIELSAHDLTPETRQWLNSPGIGQILVMALRTAPEHEPTGVVIVADELDRIWTERHLTAFGTLVSQLAWSRRYLMLTKMLQSQREELERLNWYKHRRLEEVYRAVGWNLRRLNELSSQTDPLSGTRYQQILRQLGDSMGSITQLLREEQWRLRTYYSTVPLVSLLKRSIDRVDSFLKQRQIWSQVHNDNNLTIGGDIVKIELVIYELLVAACHRIPSGGRLDLWCRQIDNRWLELSITDNGMVEPRLLSDMQNGRSVDLLAPSTLDQPPGLHLLICQSLMQQIGGEFNLYKLEDNRVLSRLVLPIATSTTPQTQIQQPSKNTGFF